MRIALAAALAFTLSGCATQTPYVPVMTAIDRPAIGETARAEVGESLIAKGQQAIVPGLVLKNTVEDMFVVIEPQKLALTYRDAEADYYLAPGAYQVMLGQRAPRNDAGICIRRNDPAFVGVFVTGVSCKRSKKPIEIDRADLKFEKGQGFVQELLYNGRSGSTVRFTYREFKDDWARPAFSQELQYDLSQGTEIGFRGVRIVVEEATNTSITYKVLSSFRSQ